MQKPITKELNPSTNGPFKTALLWAVLLLLIDRGLKMTAIIYWSNHPLIIINGWQLTYSLNRYLAFSLPWSGWILNGFLSILILGLTIYASQAIKKQPVQSWGWLFLLAGAYSNLYDRLAYGGVIDYLTSWWTIFNLADLLIGLGLIALIWPKQKERL